ncbi:MAG: DUF1207 domain-containing protein [Pleomorphochaeta sp.]
MKKSILILIITTMLILPLSARSSEPHNIDFLNLSFTTLPDDYLYPGYLADPLAVNSQITYRHYEIDEIHPQSDGTEDHFDITIGTRYNFFRISPIDHPELGIEMDWGMALTTFMNTHGTDLLGTDGIYYFALALKANQWSAFRFTRHHICAHQGDQLDTKADGSQYIDFDDNILTNESNFVRDDYMISGSVYPLYFIDPILPKLSKSLRIYGDFNFYAPGYDFLGKRMNEPFDHSYFWYQYGAELVIPLEDHNKLGSLFVAGQISRWQQTAYAPNYCLEAGIIFAPGKDAQRFKFGAQIYDGQSLLNNYQFRRAKFVGFALTIEQ